MEKITFHFEGFLADNRHLNFYEAARFQYATARLIVKLSQFREKGHFAKRITNKTNRDILIGVPKEGSFDIIAFSPVIYEAGQHFLSTKISDLLSYVFERVLAKPSDSDIIKGLNSVEAIAQEFGKIDENNSELMNKALDRINKDAEIKESLHSEVTGALRAQIALMERQLAIEKNKENFAKIDSAREQNIIRMAAPLVQEMANPLRRSAGTMDIFSEKDKTKGNIVFIDRNMAENMEISKVDDNITPIMIDIIQYNKETGWGKLRMEEFSDLISFNVPSDLNGRLKQQLINAMGREKVYLQVYIVRDKAKLPMRCIVVGILPNP